MSVSPLDFPLSLDVRHFFFCIKIFNLGTFVEANIFLGILAFIGLSLAIGKNAAEKERAQQSE